MKRGGVGSPRKSQRNKRVDPECSKGRAENSVYIIFKCKNISNGPRGQAGLWRKVELDIETVAYAHPSTMRNRRGLTPLAVEA